MISDPKHLEELNNRWDELLPYLLDFNHTVDDSDRSEVIKKIRLKYLKDKKVNKETFLQVVDVCIYARTCNENHHIQ